MAEQGELAGKVALVTGASRGIGFAIARRLGQMAARVAICARQQAEIDQAASALSGAGIEVLVLQGDVARSDQVSSLVNKT